MNNRVAAREIIRSSFGTRVLWALILIGAGIVIFILVFGGAAAASGGRAPAVLEWWIASPVAVFEVLAFWRVFRVALVMDDVGVTVRNYFRDYRIRWQELAGIDVVKEESESTTEYANSLLGYLFEYLSTRTLYGVRLRFPGGRSLNARATFRAKVNGSMMSTLQAHASRYGIPFSSQNLGGWADLTSAAPPPHRRLRLRVVRPSWPRFRRPALPRASLRDQANQWLNSIQGDDEGTGLLFALIGIPELVLLLTGMVIAGNLPLESWQFLLLAGVSFFALPVIAAWYTARLVARATPRRPILRELAAGLSLLIAILGAPLVVLVAYKLLVTLAPIR